MVRAGIIVVLLLTGCTESYIMAPTLDTNDIIGKPSYYMGPTLEPNPSSDPVLGARGKVEQPVSIQYHRGNTIERKIYDR